MNKRWRPSVTVAAVIEHDGRYLLVEEHTPEGLRLNNPAGHLEPGESPASRRWCARRWRRPARDFVPEALLGVYLARFPAAPAAAAAAAEDITYLRFAYSGTRRPIAAAGRALDTGIVRTLWLTRDEVRARPAATAARWCCAASRTIWPADPRHHARRPRNKDATSARADAGRNHRGAGRTVPRAIHARSGAADQAAHPVRHPGTHAGRLHAPAVVGVPASPHDEHRVPARAGRLAAALRPRWPTCRRGGGRARRGCEGGVGAATADRDAATARAGGAWAT
jgi:phosphatase NudJ